MYWVIKDNSSWKYAPSDQVGGDWLFMGRVLHVSLTVTTGNSISDQLSTSKRISAENNLGFRVRADLTAGGLLILLLRVACLHFTLTDYRAPPSARQGMLWCDKWPRAKWRFVRLPTCQPGPYFMRNTGGGRACRCVSVWMKGCIIVGQWERVAKVK